MIHSPTTSAARYDGGGCALGDGRFEVFGGSDKEYGHIASWEALSGEPG